MKNLFITVLASLLMIGCVEVTRGYKSVTIIMTKDKSTSSCEATSELAVAADKEYSDAFKVSTSKKEGAKAEEEEQKEEVKENVKEEVKEEVKKEETPAPTPAVTDKKENTPSVKEDKPVLNDALNVTAPSKDDIIKDIENTLNKPDEPENEDDLPELNSKKEEK